MLASGALLSFSTDIQAQTPAKKKVPKTREYEGAPADTTFEKVISGKELGPAEFGSQDIFLNSNSSSIIDAREFGLTESQMDFFVTEVGVVDIEDSKKDNSLTPGTRRVKAKGAVGSTQVLLYQALPAEGGKSKIKDKLLKIYKVTVAKNDIVDVLFQLRSLIGNVEGLELRIVGDKIVVDGQILLPREMKRVLTVLSKFTGAGGATGGSGGGTVPIINLVEVSPIANQMLAQKMQEEINGGKDREQIVKVKVLNDKFMLEGTVESPAARTSALDVCKAYLPDAYDLKPPQGEGQFISRKGQNLIPECYNRIRVKLAAGEEPDKMLSIRADFVSLNKDYTKFFKFSWAPAIDFDGKVGYDSTIGKITSAFAGTIKSLFPVLDTAAAHGYARVLKSANVLIRDGTTGNGEPPEAKFTETFTVFVPQISTVNGVTSQTQQPINANTSISVKVKSVSGGDRFQLDIAAETSEIKSGATPSQITNTLKTSAVLNNNESAALAGMISERRAVSYERDPASAANSQAASGVSGVPGQQVNNGAGSQIGSFNLFEMGRSQSFKDEKGQFIIFITPQRLQSPGEGTDQLRRRFRLRR